MLTQETIQTVKSTLPLIEEQGPKLTAYFYNRMFRHHPDLKNLFNMSHQRDERQRRALFRAITAYAANIDNVASLLGAVEKIAQKHSNFMLTKRHYDIVGEHLLATIDELLSPGEKVINAWGEAYGVLADIFLNREEKIYQENAQEDGGWRGLREFVVTQKKLESEHITSFVFEPTDGQKVKSYKPGQYIGLYINTPTFENQEIRQYSLSSAVRECSYRISVKREPGGQVSNFLHDEVQEGDKLQLVPPAGDFFIDVTPKTPVTLISAGVGLTPMLSMFESLTTHQAPVMWIHATENGAQHAFKEHVQHLVQQYLHFDAHVWYNEPLENDREGIDFQHTGWMDLNVLKDTLQASEGELYFCGPKAFMKFIAQQLRQLHLPKERCHYEFFGPHEDDLL